MFGCEEGTIEPLSFDAFEAASEPIEAKGLPLHPDAIITKLSDSKSLLELPEDVFYVYSSEKTATNAALIGSTEITCTCTEGEGCNPGKYKGKYTCTMLTGCSECTKETSKSSKSGQSNALIDIHGIVDFNQGITFLTPALTGLVQTDAYLSVHEETYGGAFGKMFEIPRVAQGIQDFLEEFYNGKVPGFLQDGSSEIPSDYSLVHVNIFGNVAAIPFPSSMFDKVNDTPGSYITSVGKITCNCKSGQSGCVRETAAAGTVQYCESGKCKSCTLKD
jgi:hypothetical protein